MKDKIDYQHLIDTGEIRNMETKYDKLIRFFLILAIITLVSIILHSVARAETVEVTASVPCNPYNCEFTTDGNRGGSGEVMGTPFNAVMVNFEPLVIRFETPYTYWFVGEEGIIPDLQALSIYLAQ